MSEHTEQTERGYQKQPGIFQGARKVASKRANDKSIRWWKNVGLGYKTPKEALNAHYIDKKCPFTGDVNIRGRILKGIVKSNKMKRTIIVRRDYLHYIKKYQRYEKRHKNFAAHLSPAFRVNEGDQVVCGECRPLSKTVRYNTIKVERTVASNAAASKSFGKF